MLYFVPTPLGNLEDITLRSLKLLEKVSLILCEDTRVAGKLILLLSQNPLFNPVKKKYIPIHSHNEDDFLNSIDSTFFEQDILYLSDAGMPCISDPGSKIIDYCIKNKIDYEVLPGPSASVLAYASSGFVEKEFLFYGFLPIKGVQRKIALLQILNSSNNTIIYESPLRIVKLVEDIVCEDPNRELFLIKEATKIYEKKIRGKAFEVLEQLKNIDTRGEWCIVVEKSQNNPVFISKSDILELDIPKKEAAKLISKITGQTPKEIYEELIRA